MEKLCVLFIICALLGNQALVVNGQSPEQRQFPVQGQLPGQNQPQQTTTPTPSGTATVSASVQQCIRACPVTSEYNPVCGSDNRVYDNPGRLICARECGAGVTQLRTGACPPSG